MMSTHQVAGIFSRLVSPLARRVRLSIGRCVIEALNDERTLQMLKVQGLADVVRDDVEHFQPGGLTHVALEGAEGLLLAVGGDSSHSVALGVSNREKRPKGLSPGETKVYAVDAGDGGVLGHLYLKADGTAELVPSGDGLVLLAGATQFLALANSVNTNFTNLIGSFNALVQVLKTHTHQASGEPTSAPNEDDNMIPASAASSVAASKVKGE